ncbi:MAG: hypothetical protein IKO93_24620 [Lentisphaeria bacterium]|nr:hypothetical protein [Lentisphaeria bacterium]
MNDKKEPVATAAQNQIEEELSKAFHLLCDAFPEPMALCHRSHRVISVNPAAVKYGRTAGSNCAQGCPGLKAGLCRQALMVKKEKTTWCHLPDGEDGHPSTSYWIPVTGQPDYYFHFGIGITIDYAKNPTEE